jgi:adenosylhomocysteinase
VGPFIQLVQAEILAGIRMLAGGDLDPGIHDVSSTDRDSIATTWLHYFNR